MRRERRNRMDITKEIQTAALKFYGDLQQDLHGRYRSWEHCYKVFYEARENRKNGEALNYDNLSLHLAFYLASWGMYRGSSFLLQQDYKVHENAVKVILSAEYDSLQGITCSELKKDHAQRLLWDLCEKLRNEYKNIRSKVVKQTRKEDETESDVSVILISKILMGTLGCVPAYDRFFVKGIKHLNVSTGIFNRKSILRLSDFYESNFDELEKTRRKLHFEGLDYPQMKLLDMGFWQIGLASSVATKGSQENA